MSNRTIHEALKFSVALAAATRTADANGATIDRKGYDSLAFAAQIGAAGDTLSGSVKIELELEHSDDGSSWSDCADADVDGAVTGTNTGCFAVIDADAEAAQVYKCGYKGSKRYVRVVYNVTGTHSTGTPAGVQAVQGHALAGAVA